MKLARISATDQPHIAIVVDGELVDLTECVGPELNTLPKFLALGSQRAAIVRRCLNSAPRIPLASANLLAPIGSPEKILGVGMNYRSFVAAAQRAGIPLSTERTWFYRPRSCIAGPYEDLWLPRGARDLDYEAELAVVIGRPCRYVPRAKASEVVAGYMAANDATLRARVVKSLVFGKSFDTHTPVGPWLVSADEIADPQDLAIRSWVNGEIRQQSRTSDMIGTCCELVAEISEVCTLKPGDIILSGTPGGSGVFHNPPVGLGPGDVVRIEIERIGAIENRVVAEPESA